MRQINGPVSQHDPMRVVNDALEAAGCPVSGEIWKGAARCPAHEDRSPSLSIAEGADGRALLHCHAGCETSAVVAALGLEWSALFPDGHRHAGGRRVIPPKPVDNAEPLIEFLAALNVVGINWTNTADPRMYIADRCPGCDERRPGALWITDYSGRAQLTCFNGCDFKAILAMIEHELTDGRVAA